MEEVRSLAIRASGKLLITQVNTPHPVLLPPPARLGELATPEYPHPQADAHGRNDAKWRASASIIIGPNHTMAGGVIQSNTIYAIRRLRAATTFLSCCTAHAAFPVFHIPVIKGVY
jgi:hypothetical protein